MERLEYLFQLYVSGRASAEEERAFWALVNEWQGEEELQLLIDDLLRKTEGKSMQEPEIEATLAAIFRAAPSSKLVSIKKRTSWFRWVAAACILMVAGVGIYVYLAGTSKPLINGPRATTHDIAAPSANRATITLADGSKIDLDSAANGSLARQGSVTVIKSGDGQLEYHTEEVGAPPANPRINVLSNPRGSRVISMTLGDGSRVWLNAGSVLTYPVPFAGDTRSVTISGEAYFEVAHDARRPFIVNKADARIEVLGTHFNVNAYDDEEAIKVTLLEGSVKLTNQVGAVIIKPGEQAQMVQGAAPKTLSAVDLNEVMAWKEGKFYFMSTDLKTIVRQLERWYDVEVTVADDIPYHFTGIINRNVKISEVFGMLQKTGAMKVKIEGKEITISK